jgi:hypothetical protein
MPDSQTATRERSIGELFGELATETSTLVRQEVKLATTEISQKAVYAGKQSVFVFGGALIGVVSMLTLAGALVLLLGQWMPLWASALIVSVVFGLVAYVVAQTGIRGLKNMELRPTQTLASFKDNKSWATKQLQ